MMEEQQFYLDNNVYILGAGFSREAKLPLVSDFLNTMRDASEWLQREEREKEYEAIERVFNFRLSSAAASYRTPIDVENIEELFSLASATDERYLNQIVPLAISATLDFAAAHNAEPIVEVPITNGGHIYENWKPTGHNSQDLDNNTASFCNVPFYEFVASLMAGRYSSSFSRRSDTVISFNYDTVLDDALRNTEVPFDYGFSKSTAEHMEMAEPNFSKEGAVKLLKLHGSVNWAAPRTPGRKIQIFESYKKVRGKGEIPLLVPPTWRKSFGGGLNEVWEQAVESLRKATRITIIGFSVPRTDIHFKYLLAAGLQNNISLRTLQVVNIDTLAIKVNLASIFRQELLENGSVEFHNCSTINYFCSGPLLRSLNRYAEDLPYGYSISDNILHTV